MKNRLIILLISIHLFSSCAPTKMDKYNAINDYLDSKVKDSEEIMIIEEKSSADLAIIMFYGHDFYPVYPDTTVLTREYGIQGLVLDKKGGADLFNKKDWSKMKKKFGKKKGVSSLNRGYWNSDDFRYKNIVFENRDVFFKNITSFKYFDVSDPEKKVFYLSYPIPYKKKYLVFSIDVKTTKSIGRSIINHTVVMEKVIGKWIVIEQAESSYFD